MSHLNRIIAIDNLSRGQFVIINTNGHTNFDGRNKSGKTTTLKLALLFYGVKGSDLAKAKGKVTQGFVNYYLPNPSSYLVYEYVRGNEINCVICSSTENSVRYQFLSGTFDKNIFLLDDLNGKSIVQNNALRTNADRFERELSPKLSPETYRSIIQSNKPYRLKTSDSESIRKWRPRYSFPTQGDSIDNIDRVLIGIFRGKVSMDAVRSTLTNILVEEGAIPDQLLSLNNHSIEINDWMAERKAWLAIDRQKPKNIELTKAAITQQGYCDDISGLLYVVSKMQNQLDIEQESINKKIQELTVQQDDTNQSLVDFDTKDRLATNELEDTFNKVLREIANLLELKDDFESPSEKYLPVAELQALFEQVDSLEYQSKKTKEHYDKISSGVSNINETFEKQRSELETTISNISLNLANSTRGFKDQNQIDKDNVVGSFGLKLKSLNDQFSLESEGLNKKERSVVGEEAQLKERLLNPVLKPELKEQLEQLKREHVQSSKNLSEAQSELLNETNVFNELKDALKKKLVEFNRLSVRKQEQIDQQVVLKSRIEDGTLFNYLRDTVPNFEDTLGKVINPELLLRKNLKPEFNEGESSLYGLKIDLSQIESKGFGNVQSIIEEIQELDKHIADLEAQIVEVKLEAKILSNKCDAKEHDVARVGLEAKQEQAFNEQLEADIQDKNTQAELWLKEHVGGIEEALSKCQSNLRVLIGQKKELSDLHQKNVEKLDAEKQTSLDLIEGKLSEQETAASTVAEEKLAELRLQIDKSIESENKAIRENGFSDDDINKSKQAYKRAQQQHERASAAGIRVRRYNKFLSSEWVKHPKLTEDKTKAEHALADQRRLSQEKRSGFELKQSQIGTALVESNEVNVLIATELKELRLMVELGQTLNIETYEAYSSRYVNYDVERLKLALDKLVEQLEETQQSGKDTFNQLQKVFIRVQRTHPARFFEKMREEVLEKVEPENLWIKAAIEIRNYFNEDHLSQESLLRSNYTVVAESISNFSTSVKEADKQLSAKGRQLTTKIGQVSNPFESMGQIDIKVSSRLKTLAYFSSLEDFAKAHNRWKYQQLNELPGDELISKLTNLVSLLNTHKPVIDIAKYFEFTVDYMDGETHKMATNDQEIAELSSNGLTYLIIVSIYIGLINLMRSDTNVKLAFCVDEFDKIDSENSMLLIKLFDEQGIRILSAQPSGKGEILQYYQHCYQIERKSDHKRIYKEYSADSINSTESKLTELLDAEEA
ncbi:MAG: hypothetical protein ACJAS9_002843 [Polaribacter sp.]|jgi:hypothetical protein